MNEISEHEQRLNNFIFVKKKGSKRERNVNYFNTYEFNSNQFVNTLKLS